MFVTAIPLLITAGFMVFGLLGQAYLLKKGAGWVRVSETRFGFALLVAVVLVLVDIGFLVLGWLLPRSVAGEGLRFQLVMLGANLLVSWGCIAAMFKTTGKRAVLVWLPTLIIPAVLLPLYYFALRPYVFETFICNGSSMSPTLLGPHTKTSCLSCGAPAIVPALAVGDFDDPRLSICPKCRHTFEAKPKPAEFSADRFFCNKLLRPRRWDIVAFRVPSRPTERYVKRVVGLPGEEVVIRDGAVWIDGKKQTPPLWCGDLKYLATIPSFNRVVWGAPENPARLGADEYFVLGDFTAAAFDSRMWDRGEPGRPPYAVPASHIEGVVTQIYWPVSRWRVLRND